MVILPVSLQRISHEKNTGTIPLLWVVQSEAGGVSGMLTFPCLCTCKNARFRADKPDLASAELSHSEQNSWRGHVYCAWHVRWCSAAGRWIATAGCWSSTATVAGCWRTCHIRGSCSLCRWRPGMSPARARLLMQIVKCLRYFVSSSPS